MPDHDRYTENTAIASDPVFTSVIRVQAGQRVNIGVMVTTSLDVISTPTGSVASMSIVLQRKMAGDTLDSATASYDTEGIGNLGWRDVEAWSIVQSTAYEASFESISDKPEPETCYYRLGTAPSMYSGGVGTVYARLGTG